MAASERRAVGASPTLSASLETLRGELRRARGDVGPLDLDALVSGDPAGYLPLLHFAVLKLSKLVARWITELGYELFAKSDTRFVEGVFRLMRTELNFRHSLTPKQFLTSGFAEKKMLLVVQLLRLVRAKHADLARERGPKKAANHQALAELAVPRAHPATGPFKALSPAVVVRQQKAGGTDSPLRHSSKSPLVEQKVRPEPPSTPWTHHQSRTLRMSTSSEQASAPPDQAAFKQLARVPSRSPARVGSATSPSTADFAGAASPASVIEYVADGDDWGRKMRSPVCGISVRRPEAFVGRSLELSSNLGAAHYESDDSDGSRVEVLPDAESAHAVFRDDTAPENNGSGDAGRAVCGDGSSDIHGGDDSIAAGWSVHHSGDPRGSCFLTQLPDEAGNTAADEETDAMPSSRRASGTSAAAPAPIGLSNSVAAEIQCQWEGDLTAAWVPPVINGCASIAGRAPGMAADGPSFALRSISSGLPGLSNAPAEICTGRAPATSRGILGLGIDYGLGAASVARGKLDAEQGDKLSVLCHSLQLPVAWPAEACNATSAAGAPLRMPPTHKESTEAPLVMADVVPSHAPSRATMLVEPATEARLSELEHVLSRVCGQFEALRAHSDSGFTKVLARLALLEGRMKLCDAAVVPGNAAHDAPHCWAGIEDSGAENATGLPPAWPGSHAGAAAAGARCPAGNVDTVLGCDGCSACGTVSLATANNEDTVYAHAVAFERMASSPQPSTSNSGPDANAEGVQMHHYIGDFDTAMTSGVSSTGKLVATRTRAPPSVPPSTNQFIAQMQRRLDETQSLLKEAAAAGLTEAVN